MVSIRSAGFSDMEILVDLWANYRKDYEEILFKENPKLKKYLVKKENCADAFRNEIKGLLKAEKAHIWIAEDGKKPVGFSLVYIKKNYPIYTPEEIGQIDIIFVQSSYRGKNISSKLRNEALKWFKSKEIRQVSLDVYKENKYAYSVYKRWGFVDACVNMRKNI